MVFFKLEYIRDFLTMAFVCCYREPLPGKWNDLDQFQKMIVLKGLRTDKITEAMQDYVAHNLGQRFIEPQVGECRALDEGVLGMFKCYLPYQRKLCQRFIGDYKLVKETYILRFSCF